MNIKCAHTDMVELKDLKPYPFNENKHGEKQVKALAKIIAKNGQRAPIVVSKRSGYITKGHGRMLALQLLGWPQAAVDFQEYESELEELNDRVADNEISRYAEFAEGEFLSNLQNLDVDIEALDFEEFGLLDFSLPEVEQLEPQCDEDEAPEVQEDAVTKIGDIWILGNHRVMCGDSTMIDQVEQLMNGEKAYALYTDPPYGMNLDTDFSKMTSDKSFHTGGKHRPVIADDKQFDAMEILPFFDSCKEVFLWGADYYLETIQRGYENLGSWIVWDKRLEESADKMYGSCFELCWSRNPHKRYIARIKWAGFFGMSSEDTKFRVHPTQKPTELHKWFFERWIPEGSLVADLFLGSGSTLIACEKTNRKCYGMELDPHYCDVTIKRWEQYTGKDAILESTGESYKQMTGQTELARCQ